jgi:hypothetical protein
MTFLDWTECDADGHATIALYLVTRHGRATPLIWRTVPKRQLQGQRNACEDSVLLRLHEVLPPGVKVMVLADRGFGDQRTHSLFRQGCHYYAAIPMMKPELLRPLVERFAEYILSQPVHVRAFTLHAV